MDRAVEAQMRARTIVRRAREEATTILDHLKYLGMRIDTFDYSFSTPSDVFAIEKEMEALDELEKRLHAIRIGLGG